MSAVEMEQVNAPERRARFGKLPTVVSAFVVTVLFSSLFVNFLLAMTVYYRAPVVQFGWLERSSGRLACNAVQLNVPSISQARIVEFARSAAVSLNSYDYFNFRTLLNSAMRQYLTIGARSTYTQALANSGILVTTRNEFVEVTAVTRQQPNIAEQGVRDGREYWIVEVPLRVFYKTNVGASDENRLIIMTVVRVQPNEKNPNGIAIDGIRSVFDSSNERI